MAGIDLVPLVTRKSRICWQTTEIVTEGGIMLLVCTEEHEHPGRHYDEVFRRQW